MSKKFGTSGWNFAGHMVEKRVKLTQMFTPSAASTFLFFFRRSRSVGFRMFSAVVMKRGQGPQCCCFGRLMIVLKVGFGYSQVYFIGQDPIHRRVHRTCIRRVFVNNHNHFEQSSVKSRVRVRPSILYRTGSYPSLVHRVLVFVEFSTEAALYFVNFVVFLLGIQNTSTGMVEETMVCSCTFVSF